MADTYTNQSPFIDKAADQADLDRQNKIDLATIGAVSKAMGSAGADAALTGSSPFVGGSAGAASAPTPQQMGLGAPAPTAQPAAAPNDPFAAFSQLLKETDPSIQALRQKATASAQSQLDNPGSAFDQGAAISREDMAKSIQTAREAQREDLIKTYGSNASQVMPQLRNFDQGALLQTRDLDRRLAADRATASQSATAQAIANAMGLTGQESNERIAAAGLGLQAAGQAEQSRQYEKTLLSQMNEADKQRAWTSAEAAVGRQFSTTERQAVEAYQTAERNGAQDFASAEAALGRKFTTEERAAIQAYQTSERLSSQTYASAEAQLGRAFTSTERQAVQAFQSAERQGAQDFASAEALLGRKFSTEERNAIEAYQTSERLSSQAFASAEAQLGRQFSSSERDAVQAFQKAERIGAQDFASAETALGRKFTTEERQAIQAYQSSERLATQTYASAEADLGRKFTTGERQAVQDFQNAQRLGAQDFQSAEAILGRQFTSSEREAIQTYQTKERLSTQDFQQMLTEKGYVHDTDLEIMRSNLQKELQATGISADQAKQQADQKFQELTRQRDQEYHAQQDNLARWWQTGERVDTQNWQKGIQANEFRQQDALAKLQALTQEKIAQGSWDNASKLQAEQLLAQAAEAEKNRSAQYLMFSAEQAQDDKHFAAEFGLKQEEVRANVDATKQQIGIALKQLGIAEDQWNTQKDNAEFDKALELAQYGISMWNGDNDEALQPFVSRLAETLGKGLGLDANTMKAAINSSFATAPTVTVNADGTTTQTPAQAFAAFDKMVTSKGGFESDDAAEALKLYAKRAANNYASAPAGVKIAGLRDVLGGSNMDAAVDRLKASGTSTAVLQSIQNRDLTGAGITGGAKYEYKGTPEFINYTLYVKMMNSGMAQADAKQALDLLIGKDKAAAALALEGKTK